VPDLASDRTPLQKTTYGTRAVRAHARGSRQKTRSRKLHRNNEHVSLLADPKLFQGTESYTGTKCMYCY